MTFIEGQQQQRTSSRRRQQLRGGKQKDANPRGTTGNNNEIEGQETHVKELRDKVAQLEKEASQYKSLKSQFLYLQKENRSMVKLAKKHVVNYHAIDVAMIVDCTK